MKMKRIWSALLSLAMILSMIPAMSIGASAEGTTVTLTADAYTDGDITVNVSATGAAESVLTAEKTDEADYASAANSILVLDDRVTYYDSEYFIADVAADSSKIIAAGTVHLDDANADAGSTTLTVTFPKSVYDPTVQQLVVKAYGSCYMTYEDEGEEYGDWENVFDYYYPDASAITDNGNGTVTVTVSYDRVLNWILAATDKHVQLLNYRGYYDYAKTVVEESGNETISFYSLSYYYIDYNTYTKVYYYYPSYSFYYNKAANTVTKDGEQVYQTDDNGIMAFCKGGERFDLLGKLGGDWKKITYGSYGYATYLQVGSNAQQISDLSGNTEVGETGLKVAVDCAIIGESGQVVKVTYTVKNVTNETKTFSLGSGADVQIGSDDYAPIRALALDSQHVGLSMTSTQSSDRDSEGNYASLAFICMNNAMATDVDTLWYGYYGDYDDEMFNGSIKTDAVTNIDSGMSYSWMDEPISGYETKTYTVFFGIGDVQKINEEMESEQQKYLDSLYTVHLNYNDGETPTLEDRQFARDNDYYLPVPTRDGYILDGWKLDDTTKYSTAEAVRNLTAAGGEITLTAVWKDALTVKIYNDAEQTELISHQTIALEEGSEVTQYPLPTPTKQDYTFKGWRYNGTLYEGGTTLEIPVSVRVVELAAIWQLTCTVTVNNGSSTGTQYVEYGETYAPGQPTARENYAFLGWEYNGVVYPADKVFSFAGYKAATLNAVWKEDAHTITFDANGGTCVRSSKELGVTAATYGTLPTPAHPYAEFDGWYDAQTDGNKVEASTAAPANDITLYAHWKNFKTYNVVINGVATANAATYGVDYTYDPGSVCNVTITIGGKPYYAAADNTGKYVISGAAITGDIVIVTEQPEADKVTLTYMFEGAAVYTVKVSKTEKYPTVELPVKAGYTVDGWYTVPECTGSKASGVIGEDAATLYAKATIKSIPVTFDDGAAVNVNYGAAISFPASNPADTAEKKFIGWTGDNGVIFLKSDSYSYNMPDVEALHFTSAWRSIGALEITVRNENGELVPGATVNLICNGLVIDSVETDANGMASFAALNYGAYNIAVVSKVNETETVTTTAGKDITGSTNALTVTVPTQKLNTVVDSSEVEMNLTSENLERATSTEIGINQDITITLKAEPASETEKAAVDAQVSSDTAESGMKEQMVDYVNLTVTKTTLTDDGDGHIIDSSEETITTTSDYQIISIEVTDELYEKLAEAEATLDHILVYRMHGGEVTKLAKVASEADGRSANFECYWLKNVEGKDYVVIKTRNFSTYAIGFRDEAVEAEGIETPAVTTYTNSGADTRNGKLIFSGRNVPAGQTVAITVEPDAGYKLGLIVLKDEDGNIIKLIKASDTTYTFEMPASNVTVSAIFVKDGICPQDETCVYSEYADADPAAWYHDGVHFCVEYGYMKGFPDGSFKPGDTLTRAQIVSILYRMAGSPAVTGTASFPDVQAGAWYAEAIAWAEQNNVVEGFTDGNFYPNNAVTREQLAAILYRNAQAEGKGFTGTWMFLLDAKDASAVSSWANEAMHWVYMKGILTGDNNGMLRPTGNATRAEAACMIQRFCEELAK